MAKQEETSKSAKILYRPIDLTSSILGGLLAGIIFKQVWRRATPGDQSTLLQRSKASTTSRRSWSQRPSKGPSTRWSRPSSTAAAPGHSNAGLVNGPVAEAIRHAKHHAAGMAPLQA